MAKRGRKPKGEYHDKVSVFSTRITAQLRADLVDASERNTRSLSQEVEHRLRRSLDGDKVAQHGWININYEACSDSGRDLDGPYKTRNEADKAASRRRISCVRIEWCEDPNKTPFRPVSVKNP